MKKLQDKNINTNEYWNEVYTTEIKKDIERIELERFEKTSELIVDSSKVLDAGCGRGDFIKFLKNKKPNCQITGIDISNVGIKDAQKNLSNCTFQTMNVYDMSKFFKDYDYVVSFETLEHLSDPKKFICNIWKVLKSNGFAIISLPYENLVLGGDEHMYSYDFQDMLNLFEKKYWQIVILMRYSKNLKNMYVVVKKI